jgi:L-alanine-DL-glutamate epimerase-like enolase superfamily enzyme
LGAPLYQLLGGHHRVELPVTWVLGAEPVAAVMEEAIGKFGPGAANELATELDL